MTEPMLTDTLTHFSDVAREARKRVDARVAADPTLGPDGQRWFDDPELQAKAKAAFLSGADGPLAAVRVLREADTDLQSESTMSLIKRRPKVQPATEQTDHRAADPDKALEQTFESGKALDVLPPKDRRPYKAPEPIADQDVGLIASVLTDAGAQIASDNANQPPNVG